MTKELESVRELIAQTRNSKSALGKLPRTLKDGWTFDACVELWNFEHGFEEEAQELHWLAHIALAHDLVEVLWPMVVTEAHQVLDQLCSDVTDADRQPLSVALNGDISGALHNMLLREIDASPCTLFETADEAVAKFAELAKQAEGDPETAK